MKHFAAFVLMMAVVLGAAVLSGCTGNSSPPPSMVSTPVPVQTTVMTPVVTSTPVPTTAIGEDTAVADKNFVDALEACYAATPVITDISTRVTFTTCLQNTPDPKGVCAVNYKNNIGRFLKGDDTTAGYAQANKGMKLAKTAYQQGLTYDYVNEKNVACSPAPLGYPI